MNEILSQSIFFGIAITLVTYEIGLWIKQKTGKAIANPLLISVILIVAVLLLFHIDYETYANGAQYISIFLTPATVSLAVPLYRQLELLKTYPKAIFGGIIAGVLTAMVSVFALSLMFGLNHEQYVTLLPKSITTAIGMGISEKMGGIVTITVVVIIVTGILGNIWQIRSAACVRSRILLPKVLPSVPVLMRWELQKPWNWVRSKAP